jgi:outer membrane protein assembly factor BamD (BamD/ComL family)
MHLITNHSKIIHPGVEVSAYKQVMNAWSNVFHWSAGDRCEEILEVYGQKFGGDMNYMPSIDDYKTVMKAHLKSCSSLSRYYEDSAALSAAATTSIPGGKALEILNLLNNVFTAGDLFLKPDVELYSHTIAVVRNTLLDWRMRRRFRDGGAADDDNNDVDANDVDATSVEKQLCLELLSGLEQMEVAMAEEATIQGHHSKVSSSLDKWFCIIRAYADAIAVLSRVPLRDEDYESIRSCEQMLESLEQFILSNADAILQCAGQDESNNKLLDEIKFSVEGAYLSNLSSQWLVSDFGTAIKNASRSEEILNRMKERSRYAVPEESFLFPAPTPKHVQALIRAHVECLRSRYFSPESNSLLEKFEELPHLKAQRLLKDLESQHAGRPIDGSLYSDIAWAWSQVPHWSSIYKRDKYTSAPHSAKALLKHTMNQYSKGSIYFSDIGTITKMYNYIFAALYSQMTRNSRNFKGKEASVKQCLELFGDMECCYKESDGVIAKPNSHTLGLILKIICNSGVSSSVECAQTIFQRLTSCGVNARQGDYLVLMKICSSDPTKVEEILYGVKSNHHKDQSAKATTALYTECISAYAKSRHQNSASKVMELFDELNQLYESTGDPDFRPDSILYGATLDAISKAKSKGDASLRLALRLLDKMERKFDAGEIVEAPNRYAYTSILSSISQAKLLDGHVLAEDLLRKMKDRSRQINNPSIRLDAVAYTALLQTLARSKCPDKIERAKKWFAEMETLYAEGNSDLKPNKITYTALINCWRTSGRPDAGEQAQKILDLVEQRYKEGDYTIKPDATLYSSVIDAWSRDKSEVKVTRAYELYSRMKEHYSKGDVDMKPNDITVSSYILLSDYLLTLKSTRSSPNKLS